MPVATGSRSKQSSLALTECCARNGSALCTHRGMKYPRIRLIHIVCLSVWATLLAANAHAQVTIDDAVAQGDRIELPLAIAGEVGAVRQVLP